MTNFTTSLGVMAMGMIGIFVVTGVIILSISGLMALQGKKKEQ